MPKITSVEPQKKNSKRFNVFLDNTFAFGADEDLVVNRRLVVGKIIISEDMEKILFEAELGKLMEKMYRLFNIRQRSEREIRDYLKKLSYKRKFKGQEALSPFIIDAVVDLMKRKSMIDDEKFALAWMESRRRSKKKGIRAIKSELFQKGIGKEIIETMDNGQWTMDNEQGLAKEALEKKLKAWKNLTDMEFRKKAYDFLARKGFEYKVIKETIENLTKKM